MENQCIVCGSVEGCLEYTTTDNHGNRNKEFVCKKCAEEFGLETDEEEEKRNRLWWRNHLRMRMGREISDEVFEEFYKNRHPIKK